MSKTCKGPKHRSDSFFSWFISVCSLVCQALNLGFALSFGVLLPELMKEFGESRQKTGKFLTLNYLPVLFTLTTSDCCISTHISSMRYSDGPFKQNS